MGRCLRTILHGGRFEFLSRKAIHQRSGVQPSLPYAVGINLKRLRHSSVWTPRSSVPTESTGKHRVVLERTSRNRAEKANLLTLQSTCLCRESELTNLLPLVHVSSDYICEITARSDLRQAIGPFQLLFLPPDVRLGLSSPTGGRMGSHPHLTH